MLDRVRQGLLYLLGAGCWFLGFVTWHLFTFTHPPENPQGSPLSSFATGAVVTGLILLMGLGNRHVHRLTLYGWACAGLAFTILITIAQAWVEPAKHLAFALLLLAPALLATSAAVQLMGRSEP